MTEITDTDELVHLRRMLSEKLEFLDRRGSHLDAQTMLDESVACLRLVIQGCDLFDLLAGPEIPMLVAASRKAIRKMESEYKRCQPDAVNGECWQEVQCLRFALEDWDDAIGKAYCSRSAS